MSYVPQSLAFRNSMFSYLSQLSVGFILFLFPKLCKVSFFPPSLSACTSVLSVLHTIPLLKDNKKIVNKLYQLGNTTQKFTNTSASCKFRRNINKLASHIKLSSFTVIPRLTNIIRFGITFVSRNVISCVFL
jgi:hypothetical protein